MAYIGDKPSQTLASPTSQYFNGDGSTVAFTLNRPVNVSEDLEVFVNNVQQEPGVGKSYTATGTTLTFDAAPSSGTGNVYVVYRGLAEVTTRLEHDPNAALAATTGDFSAASGAYVKVTDTTNNAVGALEALDTEIQFGTTSAHGLMFKTGNTEAARIQADGDVVLGQNGYVGIFSSNISPSHVFHIEKSVGSGLLAYFNNTNPSSANVLRLNSSGNGSGTDLFDVQGGTVSRFKVRGDGVVTMPKQPSFFAAGSGTTINSSTDTKLLFSTEVFDIGSNYDTSTSRFTAPVDGLYLFKSAVRCPLSGASEMRFDMLFTVNGSGRAGEGINQQNTNDAGVSSSVIIELSANDYVEVWVNQNSGNSAATSASLNLAQGGNERATHFWGYLIG